MIRCDKSLTGVGLMCINVWERAMNVGGACQFVKCKYIYHGSMYLYYTNGDHVNPIVNEFKYELVHL